MGFPSMKSGNASIPLSHGMVSFKRPSFKEAVSRHFLSVVLITFSGAVLLFFLIGTNSLLNYMTKRSDETVEDYKLNYNYSHFREKLNLPKQNDLSISLEKYNQLPPRNLGRYPILASDHIIIVLYVHNRPHYLQVVVQSLSQVVGINETLLIVSHDGYFEEMNKIVETIMFCQVKQIFAPYSPHLFSNSFPGVSPNDCRYRDNATKKNCDGNPDHFGRHRSPKFVSLKHHWWWMMNTVWDGLKETRQRSGHILFIEEDHFIFPNAYRNLQLLISLKPKKCPDCYTANLAPCDVHSRGEGWESLVAEKIGNVGYAFNRTIWRKIHTKAKEFCFSDDYNWDLTMWDTVYPSFGGPVYALRGPRSSALHFGKCGLHQGQWGTDACIDNGMVNIEVKEIDKVANIKSEWEVHIEKRQELFEHWFENWGRSGHWGDKRDHQLCLSFAKMYHFGDDLPPF